MAKQSNETLLKSSPVYGGNKERKTEMSHLAGRMLSSQESSLVCTDGSSSIKWRNKYNSRSVNDIHIEGMVQQLNSLLRGCRNYKPLPLVEKRLKGNLKKYSLS